MKIATHQVVCPSCQGSNFRRSRRRVFWDYLLSYVGILPWRCHACETRFYARPFPVRNLFYAHCRICGNLGLQRISPDHVSGAAALLARLFGVPALRCAPCRNKFFSVRPLRREASKEAAAEGP